MRFMKTVLAISVMGVVSACSMTPKSETIGAKAVMESRSNSTAKGTVTFQEKGDKVLVKVSVSGLTPGQEHGFHVHEKGDCSAPDATSAGGHFNPEQHPHAHPGQAKRHAGAMHNLKADAYGEVNTTLEVDTIRLDDGKYSVIGRGLIIHAKPDDYVSQPVGNAGARLACGVIVKS